MPETAAVISTLILERPMCIPCLARKVPASETEVEAALAQIVPVIQIHRELDGRCRVCGQTTVVVSVNGVGERRALSGGEKPPRLIDFIRRKVDAGQLPKKKADKVWQTHGTLVPCDACGARVLPAQVEYSFTIDEKFFRFHVGCYGLWEAERRRRGESS